MYVVGQLCERGEQVRALVHRKEFVTRNTMYYDDGSTITFR
jgi:hypothetical protein